ncbi:MAG: Retron-type reverse transcriptase [Bradyrhizobium sp. 35-63-5]|nr:MAG: Retron-type reverse transcriptase [Bradyrhizobium sp. 35-63-5]
MMQPRPSIFGGSWWNDDNAGSRQANVDNWADNSNENLGARGRSDDCNDRLSMPVFAGGDMTRRRSRSRRSTTSIDQGRWSARLSCFGEYTSRSGIAGRSASSGASRPAAGSLFGSIMGKRYRNLIGRITAPETLRVAYRLTSQGKRLTAGFLNFKEYDALNLADLARDMARGDYTASAPHEFYILDPKRRLISALSFRDRVAQQALCLVIGPILDRALLPHCYACRKGKGTHAGVVAVQSDLRRLARRGAVHVLKTDFSRYFASIERHTLWRMIEAKISCRATLRLIEAMVPRDGIGLPIGSLTSQIFANLYAGATLDRHLQQTLGEDYWYRYMDDLVVLGHDAEHLRAVKRSIEAFSRDRLGLRFSKWSIQPAARGINFLGYRIWPTHKLLRRDSVTRARRKIAAYRAGGDDGRLGKFLGAWLGHARWADSANLIRSLGIEVAR